MIVDWVGPTTSDMLDDAISVLTDVSGFTASASADICEDSTKTDGYSSDNGSKEKAPDGRRRTRLRQWWTGSECGSDTREVIRRHPMDSQQQSLMIINSKHAHLNKFTKK